MIYVPNFVKLSLITIVLSIATAAHSQETSKPVTLKSQHGGIVFAGRFSELRATADPLNPLVGEPLPVVNITRADLTLALLMAVPESTPRAVVTQAVQKVFTDENPIKFFWIRSRGKSNLTDDVRKPQLVFARVIPDKSKDTDKDIVQIILKNVSHNSELTVTLHTPGLDLPVQTRPIESAGLKWSGRGSVSSTSNLKDSKVETVDGLTRTGPTVTINTTYLGIGNPLQNAPFFRDVLLNEKSYHDFNLTAVLSKFSLDKESRIEGSWSGVSSTLSSKSLVAQTGFGFQTSQNVFLNSGFFDWSWRFGDHRSTGNSYYTAESSPAPIYFEFGAQFGASFANSKDGILLGEYPGFAPLFRPNITLGVHKANIFGGTLTATIQYFYLLDNYSASLIDDQWRETFSVSYSFGPDSNKFTFGLSGGTNPSSGFARIDPKYSAGITVKF